MLAYTERCTQLKKPANHGAMVICIIITSIITIMCNPYKAVLKRLLYGDLYINPLFVKSIIIIVANIHLVELDGLLVETLLSGRSLKKRINKHPG